MFAMNVDEGQCVSVEEQCVLDIAKAKRGNKKAVGRLLSHLESFLLTSARRYLRSNLSSRVSPEDIFQNAAIKVLCSVKTFNGDTIAEFASWCDTIVYRAALTESVSNFRAKRSVRSELGGLDMSLFADDQCGDHSLSEIVATEEFESVLLAMNELPSDQAEAVRLRYIEGLRLSAIGERMNKSKSQVHGLLKRGIRKLKDNLVF